VLSCAVAEVDHSGMPEPVLVVRFLAVGTLASSSPATLPTTASPAGRLAPAADRPTGPLIRGALPEVKDDPHALAAYIAGIPGGDKNRLLGLVAADQATRARMELLRGFRGRPARAATGPGGRWPNS